MVKFPLPVQPEPVPVKFHVPVTALLVSVPSNVSWLVPLAFDAPDCSVIWKFPVVTPLVVPVEVNEPVPVVPEAKHDDAVLKLMLLTVTAPLLFEFRLTPNTKKVVPSVLVNVADQLPLIALLEPPPHPLSISAAMHATETKNCLIFKPPKKYLSRCEPRAVGS
jgi:hypothetical protein